MRNRMNGAPLPLLAAALGGLGLVLRRLLYVFALEEYRLMKRGHLLEWLLWALVIGTAIVLVKLPKGGRRRETSIPEGIGRLLAAAGIAVTVLGSGPMLPGLLGKLWRWLGMAAAPCLAASGVLKIAGKKGSFLLTMVPCLFLVAHLINFYQTWSSQPQLMHYVFSLLGAAALTFFAYFLTAEQAEMGKPEGLKRAAFAAVFLCLTALYQEPCRWLYLGGAAWALTALWEPKPLAEEGRL